MLSVEGQEHVERNPYDDYFASDETFRDLPVDDRRLQPKEPVFSFWLAGKPYAAAHSAFAGGKLFAPSGIDGQRLFLYRKKRSPMFTSSRAWLIESERLAGGTRPGQLLALVEAGGDGIEPLAGIDTFWYTWVLINEESELLH